MSSGTSQKFISSLQSTPLPNAPHVFVCKYGSSPPESHSHNCVPIAITWEGTRLFMCHSCVPLTTQRPLSCCSVFPGYLYRGRSTKHYLYPSHNFPNTVFLNHCSSFPLLSHSRKPVIREHSTEKKSFKSH